jgi:hypothetical protein
MWAAFGVDQLSYRACRSAEHAVTDRSGSRDDRAETETRKHQRVAHLADGVPRPMVQDRRERAAGGDERATLHLTRSDGTASERAVGFESAKMTGRSACHAIKRLHRQAPR